MKNQRKTKRTRSEYRVYNPFNAALRRAKQCSEVNRLAKVKSAPCRSRCALYARFSPARALSIADTLFKPRWKGRRCFSVQSRRHRERQADGGTSGVVPATFAGYMQIERSLVCLWCWSRSCILFLSSTLTRVIFFIFLFTSESKVRGRR